MTEPSQEHDRAEQRLGVALTDEGSAYSRCQAAVGTSGELAADADLNAATAQVAARTTWLACVDTEGSYITAEAGRAAADRKFEVDAWLTWVDDGGHAGHVADEVAHLRR
jgi:hypothetical protein